MTMPKGGYRNRSGPAPDERSRTSERKGYSLTALPASGYDGPVPEWPLPTYSDAVDEDASEWTENNAAQMDAREAELWLWAWRTPQACAWSMPSEFWRAQTVARWVRQAVHCEGLSAKAADHGQLHRYADQIGMTTAGLREMGWKVAVDELAVRREEPAEPTEAAPAPARRMRAVSDGG
jgi:hypothetical protein